ncbi:hypothetical protein DL95DRAFT_403237 [Leptodontidium sp. 2 PMI_412]|nr:hypothetical protein DL95DRAFT_403237 [Leptodontidium sp. 2 PMI_412]
MTPHAYGIETSFETEYGASGRVVTYKAEYDALPRLGHACGHNLIAPSSVGAFLAVVDALKESGNPGRVRLLGTPAKEDIREKIKLVEKGAYKDVNAYLMIHPTSSSVYPEGVLGDAYDRTLAITAFRVTFRGKPAHAALAPWDGVNTLDAAIAGYTSFGILIQQIRPDERIHGSVKKVEQQQILFQTRLCWSSEGAAVATGCEVDFLPLGAYADLRPHFPICQAFQDAMVRFGYQVQNNTTRVTTPASTDQGNVSYECPSWQGIFGIPSNGAFPHTVGFPGGARPEASFEGCLLNIEGMLKHRNGTKNARFGQSN